MMHRFARNLLIACAICFVAPCQLNAQYPFGKNKVLYAPKDWKLLQTAHVDIYYYPDELRVAQFIAALADSVYDEYASFFVVEFENRIPVILYGTHHDFKETNVIPNFIPESVAGFTEFIKGRIALPFTGSYPKLRKVFRHELTHEFMLNKLHVVMSERKHPNYNEPPLWFVEGLAEFAANRGTNTEAHMFLRDAVTGDLLSPLPDMWRIDGTFLMYKEGESAVQYIANRFGENSIRLILENWWKSDRFDLVLEKTIGISVKRLSDDWEEFLRRRYYPSIMERRKIDEIGKALVEGEAAFEIYPACDPAAGKGSRVFCVGYNRGSIDILELVTGDQGQGRERIFIRGGQKSDFESIPPLSSRISLRGDTLLFVSKAGAQDAVYLYDVARRRIIKKFSIPVARVLSSPTLSPDGRSVAFSAMDGFGKSDLFVYDLASDSYERLTDDY
ncbi:MAG: hypothetical protein PHD74_06910, partial [Candidatus Krumholzibacteria bacterium]|nr:hypothetical protein [Candidatus Krumholzibacteria bacterium]